jgi:hypothetical protein
LDVIADDCVRCVIHVLGDCCISNIADVFLSDGCTYNITHVFLCNGYGGNMADAFLTCSCSDPFAAEV